MYLGSEAIDAFCLIEKDLCRNFMSHLLNPALDNVDRFEMGVSDLPAGQTYRAMVYYAQSIREDYRFSLYNYGPIENRRIYGSSDPPVVPLQDYKLPTVFQSGLYDQFAPPEDVSWLAEQLGDNVVFNKEYDYLNHIGFSIANDMSFFSVDTVDQLQKYNPTNKVSDSHLDYLN